MARKCGIKQNDLINKPKLSEVLPRFISCIKNLTDEVSTLTKRKYFPGTHTKQLLDEVEHGIMSYQNRGLCYLPKPKAEADNTDKRF